jgi:hypothetical protein
MASVLMVGKKVMIKNIAVGITRTYRGGKLLHVPILWNKHLILNGNGIITCSWRTVIILLLNSLTLIRN